MNIVFVVVFCLGLVKTLEDDDECSTCNCLLYKGTRLKKKIKKKKVDLHLYAIDAWVVFRSNIFCNNVSITFSTITFQQCLLSHRFQQHLLQQSFNIAFIAPSSLNSDFATTLLCFDVVTILSCYFVITLGS